MVNMTIFYSDDPLKVYLHEVGTIQPLTRDEETDLLQHVRTQDEQAELASKRLIEANLSLVVSIAERHSSAGLSMLDLIQEGNLGLQFALTTFPRSSDTFSVHAATCIEHAISKAITELRSATE
jgi:RNA polymerase primary sigma factor